MKHFNSVGFIICCLFCLIPDLLLFVLNYGIKHHLFSYEVRQYVSYLSRIPWTGFVFALLYGPAAKISFPNSTKIKFDEMAGYVLIVPLVQFTVPLVSGFAAPYLDLFSIPVPVLVQAVYAALLATLARGVLGLEALGLLSTIGVAILAGGITAISTIIPGPIVPDQFFYLLIGGFISFIAAKNMN